MPRVHRSLLQVLQTFRQLPTTHVERPLLHTAQRLSAAPTLQTPSTPFLFAQRWTTPCASAPFRHSLNPTSSLLTSTSNVAAPLGLLQSPILQQVRFGSRGTEYQPSQRKRKRTFGFLARKKTVGGRKVLARRLAKGRRYLSH